MEGSVHPIAWWRDRLALWFFAFLVGAIPFRVLAWNQVDIKRGVSGEISANFLNFITEPCNVSLGSSEDVSVFHPSVEMICASFKLNRSGLLYGDVMGPSKNRALGC